MPTILLVNDDDLRRDALHQTVVRAGYEMGDAADGTAALQAYHRQRRDLVITDIVMPGKEGLVTIRGLRAHDVAVKIIAISGGGLGRADDYLNLAQKFGATRILTKPFSGAEIVALVAEVLARPVTWISDEDFAISIDPIVSSRLFVRVRLLTPSVVLIHSRGSDSLPVPVHSRIVQLSHHDAGAVAAACCAGRSPSRSRSARR